MTIPDLPDFAPAAVNLARSLFLVPLTAPAAPPVFSNPIDVSPYSSIDIYIQLNGNTALGSAAISIAWLSAGQLVATDYFSVWNGWPIAAPFGNAQLILPCKGDQVLVSILSGSNVVTAQYSLIGSTRQIASPIVSSNVVQDSLMAVLEIGATLAANGSQLFYCGPFAQGVHVAVYASVPKLAATIFARVLDSGNWVNALVGEVISGTASGNSVDIIIPGRAIVIQMLNTDTSGRTYDLSVSELV